MGRRNCNQKEKALLSPVVCHGFMSAKLNSSDIENTTSFQFFEAGKNRDGWFTNKDLVEQLHKCAPLFKHFIYSPEQFRRWEE